MRIVFFRLAIFAPLITALPRAFGDRRRVKCDDAGNLQGVGSILSSHEHERGRNFTADVLLPAAALILSDHDTAGSATIVSLSPAAALSFTDPKDKGERIEHLAVKGIAISAGVVLVVLFLLRLWISAYVIEEHKRHEPMNVDSSITIDVSRSSGEELVTFQADRSWSGRRLLEEASKHAGDDEYVCQLVSDNGDGSETVLDNYQLLASLGIANGFKLRAITRRCCAIASGESLFVGLKVVGPSRQKARVWLHDDMSAILMCSNHVPPEETAVTTSMEGYLDEAGNLRFSSVGRNAIGLLKGVYGRQEIALFQVPMLGNVTLKQSKVEAVFDVRESMLSIGWLTFFCDGEVVLRTSSLSGGKVPAHICLWWQRGEVESGSTKISFSCAGDVLDWPNNFDRGGSALMKDCSGSWNGPIGRRKLLLFNFPSIGNVELVEHPIS